VVMVVVRCPTVQVFVFDEFVVIAEGNSVWSWCCWLQFRKAKT